MTGKQQRKLRTNLENKQKLSFLFEVLFYSSPSKNFILYYFIFLTHILSYNANLRVLTKLYLMGVVLGARTSWGNLFIILKAPIKLLSF